jgi:hypothetical protein
MPTDVEFSLVTGERYACLRLQGVLDHTTADALRGPLLSFVADQAPPTVIDVDRLRVGDASALSLFADVARETADWPAGPPMVSWPEGDLAAWGPVDFPVTNGQTLPSYSETEVLSADFEPVTGAARKARELVTEGCARWDLPTVAGPACIVATELVNNVVAHAHTPMTVRFGLGHDGQAVHLSVRDHGAGLPKPGGPISMSASGGRGLLLVEAVAARWGTSALPDGKLVWAVVPPDDDEVG